MGIVLNVLLLLLALWNKVGYNHMPATIGPVLVGGINSICTMMRAFAKQFLVQLYCFFQLCTFIKGIVAEVLYKADTIYLQFIDLSAKLNGLYFLASYYRTDIRFA